MKAKWTASEQEREIKQRRLGNCESSLRASGNSWDREAGECHSLWSPSLQQGRRELYFGLASLQDNFSVPRYTAQNLLPPNKGSKQEQQAITTCSKWLPKTVWHKPSCFYIGHFFKTGRYLFCLSHKKKHKKSNKMKRQEYLTNEGKKNLQR